MRTPELQEFAQKHQIKFITIADLVAYRRKTECSVEREASAKLPTRYGDFIMYGYENKVTGEHHVALVMGDIADGKPVLDFEEHGMAAEAERLCREKLQR